jgi:hypothetical protein
MTVRKWLLLTVPLVVILGFLGFALIGPRTVFLASSGGSVVKARDPAGLPWDDRVVTFSVGRSNVFAVWKDFWDCPLFVYSFADARRFLCIYDDDTALLTFVVDCEPRGTNAINLRPWPPDDYTREHLERRATNVVVNCNGVVRLPTYAEVQEVSSKVKAWTPQQLRAATFPGLDFGFCQFRSSDKEFVLRLLDPNRNSVWPTK